MKNEHSIMRKSTMFAAAAAGVFALSLAAGVAHAATPTIALNPTSGTPGTTFTVSGSGFTPSEVVDMSFDGGMSTTTADMGGDFSTTMTVPSTVVSASMPETVMATGATSGMTTSTVFTIMPSAATTTPDLSALQNEILQLQADVTNLINEVQDFLHGNGGASTPADAPSSSDLPTSLGGSGTFPASTLAATIDSVGPVRVGTSVDFTGRNWETNEQVQVANNGNVVATAQADGGGNFSTGSLPVTNTPSSQTYTFTGMSSGLSRSVTITVTP